MSSWRVGSGAQLPTLPGTLHARQVPVQALVQQTPSTQVPLRHSLEAAQVRPASFFGRQRPDSQRFPALQSTSAAQVALHAPRPSQVLRPHSPAESVPAAVGVHPPTSPGTLQATQAPSQALLQQTPSTQKPLAQSVFTAQVRPLPFGPAHAPPEQ
jgi:hypothetical protein